MLTEAHPPPALLVEPTPLLSRGALRSIARAIALVWLAIATVNVGLSQIGGVDLALASDVVVSSLCGMILSFIFHYAMIALHIGLYRSHAGRDASFVEILLLASTCGVLLWGADVLIQAWTQGHRFTDGWPFGDFMRRRLNLVYFAMLFILQGLACKVMGSALVLETRERQLLEARLAAMRFQLNPHFIFNTLNAIASLVADVRVGQAGEMIARLSDFLRATLDGEPAELVPLAAEIDLIRAYLEIEGVRFGDRLKVRYACAAGLADAQVPSLILQPLVENAIKYGLAPSHQPVTISIRASADGGELFLVVEDDGGVGREKDSIPSTGVGHANIAARLAALYGQAGRIELTSRDDGYRAIVRLPLTIAREE